MKTKKTFSSLKINFEKLSLILFIFSSLFLMLVYGLAAGKYQLFPYQIFDQGIDGLRKIRNQIFDEIPGYYIRLKKPIPNIVPDTAQINEGLNLVTKITTDHNLSAEIIDLNGKIVHKWDIDCFKMWPNPQHLSEDYIPKGKPGADIHGAVVMENGDLIFNFGMLGLIRIDLNGEVVWRLPYQTHHSVHKHDDGNLWVSGAKYHTKRISYLPHLVPPTLEDTILEISPKGKILREWSVAEILHKNGYTALLYLGTLDQDTKINNDGPLSQDIFHLNDVEPFSSKLEEGFFKQGDVMVSLRNINTVFVFNSESEKIKFISMGQFVRQHDPDFIDGNTISVFDNYNISSYQPELRQSRILIISAPENTSKIFFEGTVEKPFFTHLMGKHQWQPNGNLLITESRSGRAFEINKQGEIVWQYVNYIEPEIVGEVTEVQRLTVEYTDLFPVKE